MDGISSVGVNGAEFETAYDMAVMKKAMNMQEQQAEMLINEMLAAVPVGAPSQYGFDIYC